MTAPIARVASSLLKEQVVSAPVFPIIRMCFRAFEEEAGTRIGIFSDGCGVDRGCFVRSRCRGRGLAIASLQAAGVEKFKIALGHVGFLMDCSTKHWMTAQMNSCPERVFAQPGLCRIPGSD